MLMAEPTKHGAGLILYGDYRDLRSVHETIHCLAAESPLSDEDPAYELAYEIRHAYQRQRELKQVHWKGADRIELLGCRLVWPIFLFELRWLRGFASIRPTTLQNQADLFQLEACAAAALREVDASIADACLTWLQRAQRPVEGFLPQHVWEIGRQFVLLSGRRRRLTALPTLLAHLEVDSAAYRDFRAEVTAAARARGCSPLLIQIKGDWPDFRW